MSEEFLFPITLPSSDYLGLSFYPNTLSIGARCTLAFLDNFSGSYIIAGDGKTIYELGVSNPVTTKVTIFDITLYDNTETGIGYDEIFTLPIYNLNDGWTILSNYSGSTLTEISTLTLNELVGLGN